MQEGIRLQKEVAVFFRMLESFQNSERGSLFLLLQRNQFYKSIVVKNFYNLNKTVTAYEKGKYDEALWKHQLLKSRSAFQKEIARLIFNHLSGLFGFIDFTRKHNVQYLKENPTIFKASELGNYLKQDPAHHFIQDLRNFTVHNRAVPVGMEIKSNFELRTHERNIYIEKPSMQGWEWSSISQKFLDEQGEKIYIVSILKEHFTRFMEMQKMMFSQLLQVAPSKTEKFFQDMKSVHGQALVIKVTGSLAFDDVFIRYIQYHITKLKLTVISK